MNAIIISGHRDGTKIAAIRDELESIHERKAELTPKLIVETARDKTNILHSCFEWDNAKAGPRFRLAQALWLIHSVKVRVITNGENSRQRAFVCPQPGFSRYIPMETVVESEELTESMISIARQELSAFQKKYRGLKALADLMPVIDETLEKLKKAK